MKLPNDIQIPKNIRPHNKKTRFWVDNEILEKYGPQLKAQGIAIYCSLAKHANSKTQMCYPSYSKIMENTGIGKRNTISKYLKILEKLGLIIIDRNKKREVNIYWMVRVKTDSAQIDTSKIEYGQKEQTQYPDSIPHSTNTDTLNQRTNSNKETENISIKEEGNAISFKDYFKDNKPEFLKNI